MVMFCLLKALEIMVTTVLLSKTNLSSFLAPYSYRYNSKAANLITSLLLWNFHPDLQPALPAGIPRQ